MKRILLWVFIIIGGAVLLMLVMNGCARPGIGPNHILIVQEPPMVKDFQDCPKGWHRVPVEGVSDPNDDFLICAKNKRW